MPAKRYQQFKAYIPAHVIDSLALLGHYSRSGVICEEIGTMTQVADIGEVRQVRAVDVQ